MKITFGAGTDVGRTRDHNEDNFLVDKNLQLFVVCDGMGGHAAGEVASAMTVNIVHDDLARNRDLIQSFASGSDEVTRRDILTLLEQAVQHACYQVYERAQQNPDQRGMGTTAVVLTVIAGRGFIAHVGDSRIYLSRQGQIHQLTEDHSLINELLKQGRIHAGAGVPSRYKNAVTRAVGVYESVEVDTLDFDILPGDRFMLCTDGLHGYLTNERLLRLMEHEDNDVIVKRLIDFANDQGGKDNITAIVVTVPESEPDVRYDQVRRKLATLKGLALFKYLNYQELVKVMNIAQEKSFPQQSVIFRENEEEDCLYIILTGVVSILKDDREVAQLGEGTHFGEMALLDKAPRSAGAVALSDVQTLSISRRAFYDILRKNPSLAVKLLWSFLKVMSARLRSTSAELTDARSARETELTPETADVLPSSWLEPIQTGEHDVRSLGLDEASLEEKPRPPAPIQPSSTPPQANAATTGDTDTTIPGMPAFTDFDDDDAPRGIHDTIPDMPALTSEEFARLQAEAARLAPDIEDPSTKGLSSTDGKDDER